MQKLVIDFNCNHYQPQPLWLQCLVLSCWRFVANLKAGAVMYLYVGDKFFCTLFALIGDA